MKSNFREILSTGSSRTITDIVVDTVGNNSDYFDIIIDLSLNENKPINWRAAWVAEFCIRKYPDLFLPHAGKIAKKYSDFTTSGLKRIYAKVLVNYIDRISQTAVHALMKIAFDYLMSEKEDIAVRVNCMQILYEISKIIPEITGELQAVMQFNFENESAAFRSRAGKILKLINSV